MKNWNKSDTKFLYKLIAVVLILTVLLGIGYYNELERERKLKNGFKTKAVITWRTKTHLKGGQNATVKYKINNDVFDNPIICGCQDNEVGDTVIIKVANEDHNLIFMIDKEFENRKKFYSKDELKELDKNTPYNSKQAPAQILPRNNK